MILMMNEQGIKESKLDPNFEVLAYADAEVEPSDFNIGPYSAIKKVLSMAQLNSS